MRRSYCQICDSAFIAAALIGAFIVVALFPWRDLLSDNYYDHKRLIQVVLLLMMALTLVSSQVRNLSFAAIKHPVMVVGVFLLLSSGLMGVWQGPFKHYALLNYLHWCLLIALFAWSAGVAEGHGRLILRILVAVHSVAVILACIYLLFALLNQDALNPEVIYPGVVHVRFFNQVQVFVVPLLLLYLAWRPLGLLAFALLVANWLLLFVGGARGAILVLLTLAGLVVVAAPAYRRRVYVFLMAVAVAGIVYLMLSSQGPPGPLGSQGLEITHPLMRSGTGGRTDMWLEILTSLEWPSVLWGVGPGSYNVFSDLLMNSHPHNSVLQLLLEWGGLGLLGGGLLVGRILWLAGIYIRRNPWDDMAHALFAVVMGALGHSLVSGIIVMPVPQTLLFVFLGLLYGHVTERPQIPTVPMVRQQCGSLIAGIVVALVMAPYLWLVIQYYAQQIDPAFFRGPAFWKNGAPLVLPVDQTK